MNERLKTEDSNAELINSLSPHFSGWKNELKIYAKSLNYTKDKNAQKLLYNLSLYLVIE